jgi:SAM-dependent methyltransferase
MFTVARTNDDHVAFSKDLCQFIAESPLNRPHIARLVCEFAGRLPADARVLDAGAGTAPYRELFGRGTYVTADWSHSIYEAARHSDIVGPITELPVADASFSAVVATEVLEHVSDPCAALRELHRVLQPGGRILITVPFVWELHEEPHDFFRYTRYGLQHLLLTAGFVNEQIFDFGGYFSVVGQLVKNFGSITGVSRDSGLLRRCVAHSLVHVAPALRVLDCLDRRQGLPIGYGAWAESPSSGATRRGGAGGSSDVEPRPSVSDPPSRPPAAC